MSDPETAHVVMHALADLGVRLVRRRLRHRLQLLEYLLKLPIDEIKLDRAFCEDLVTELRSVAIVRSTVDLTHALGLHMVAEGVEDGDTLEILRELGCDLVQGWHLGRPMAADRSRCWAPSSSEAARSRPSAGSDGGDVGHRPVKAARRPRHRRRAGRGTSPTVSADLVGGDLGEQLARRAPVRREGGGLERAVECRRVARARRRRRRAAGPGWRSARPRRRSLGRRGRGARPTSSAIRARERAVASPSGLTSAPVLKMVRAIHCRIRVLPTRTRASRTVRTSRRSPRWLPCEAISSICTTRPGSRRRTSSISSKSRSRLSMRQRELHAVRAPTGGRSGRGRRRAARWRSPGGTRNRGPWPTRRPRGSRPSRPASARRTAGSAPPGRGPPRGCSAWTSIFTIEASSRSRSAPSTQTKSSSASRKPASTRAAAALDDLVVEGDGLQDLDHGAGGRQRHGRLADQDASLGVAEHVLVADQLLDPDGQGAQQHLRPSSGRRRRRSGRGRRGGRAARRRRRGPRGRRSAAGRRGPGLEVAGLREWCVLTLEPPLAGRRPVDSVANCRRVDRGVAIHRKAFRPIARR